MIRKLLQWINRRKEWHADHLKTWDGMSVLDPTGVSKFQSTALASLQGHGIQLPFKQVGSSEKYLLASIPGSEIDVYLYVNGAQVVGEHNILVAEEWDFRTPDELIQELVRVVGTVIQESRSTMKPAPSLAPSKD